MAQTPSIERLSTACGAVLGGIDLADPLTAQTVEFVRGALLEHQVIFFRDQSLTPQSLLRLAGYFGTIGRYPMVSGVPGYPDVVEVVKLEHERINFGGLWHSDTAYLERPPMASILYAVEVPPVGGDTLWANACEAYETLSHGMQEVLEGKIAVHTSAKAEVSKTREDRRGDHPPELDPGPLCAEHPLVRTHPETGRKALYVSSAHTERIKGLTRAESAAILEFLYRWQTRPELTCRFRWKPGSLAFWDNRCTLHNPLNDYHGFRRVMHRVTLEGDVPV